MGEFADEVVKRLKDHLAQFCTSYKWDTEYLIAETPVDIAGIDGDRYVLIELEWRRADPADNAAKIFRHLSTREIPADQVIILQLFTNHYNLISDGVSSKRKNAEFVGKTAAGTIDYLTYQPLDFDIDPPRSGEERPNKWEEITDDVSATISSIVSCS
ncbi:hypothetical protein [Halapricum salinum]|uniref:Restriction endonuclease type IV Mrr domain-containing protein n=1 Tax=Halapricum salinum TaxID=1457250 RepID=A0A4D6H7X2_9EURY|nr:hypothetical protein [Halapricum salinum]QCC49923.1 hypothetical protein DV733_01200 [Halapricum salinum]